MFSKCICLSTGQNRRGLRCSSVTYFVAICSLVAPRPRLFWLAHIDKAILKTRPRTPGLVKVGCPSDTIRSGPPIRLNVCDTAASHPCWSGSGEGSLAWVAWFGPPTARRNLALSMLLFCNGLRVNCRGWRKSGYLEGWKGCATKWGGLCRWVLTKDSSGFEDGRA